MHGPAGLCQGFGFTLMMTCPKATEQKGDRISLPFSRVTMTAVLRINRGETSPEAGRPVFTSFLLIQVKDEDHLVHSHSKIGNKK